MTTRSAARPRRKLFMSLLLLAGKERSVSAFSFVRGGSRRRPFQSSLGVQKCQTSPPTTPLRMSVGNGDDDDSGVGLEDDDYGEYNDIDEFGSVFSDMENTMDDQANSDNNSSMEDQMLEFSMDSFLRGDYEFQFKDDAPAPHPGLLPQNIIKAALQSLRQLDDPEPSHGAAVLMRFCVPLSRGERWGGDSSSSKKKQTKALLVVTTSSTASSWKEVMRGAITPTMLARRLRASQFSCLLDWDSLDVRDDGIELGVVPSSIAFVDAALSFNSNEGNQKNGKDDVEEPMVVQFTLRKINGVWLIDSARVSPEKLFVDNNR